ncbi:hypothetical protein BDN70DRAFT_873229 [Pholiota conissans]|uniref:Uncharacterized protein n=1 Tax=Pholiota conissans TaxID=109636 RepID=A0A9P6CX98_9AGAR|nr:hypothetical protein BDN70DRAFT_873229 [Pholiota conissans]
MSNEPPIVLAPRPVRLAAAFLDGNKQAPSDALDEFLSILTPAFLRPHLDSRWSFALTSPVSRTLTRNPFQRTLAARSPVLIPPAPPLTPAAVPLPPSPTPEQLIERIESL